MTMSATTPALQLAPGPHLRAGTSTRAIMWWVTGSLAPVFAWAVYLFGLRVIGLTLSGVLGAAAAEWLVNRLRRQQQTLGDGSAVLTGMLLVGTLSPGVPLWLPAFGGFVGVLFAKMLFGGLGFNIFNPALIGRAFLMASYPVAMTTTWLPPPGAPHAETHATILNVLKLEGLTRVVETFGSGFTFYRDLLLGLRAGSIGEVSIVLVAVGAIILVARGIIRLYIPLAVLVGTGLVALASATPLTHLLTGGLWFGAWYMATDYVTAPLLPRAQILFGLGIGLITGVIRLWGGYPEGICYAILMMNTLTPAMNQWFRPRRPRARWEGAPS